MKTILQKITDTLEAAGIGVSSIATYPQDDGAVSVTLQVYPVPDHHEPLPCPDCDDAGPECSCSENSKPITPYDPVDAIRAMIYEGAILKNSDGHKCYWGVENDELRFWVQKDENNFHALLDFHGLYSED